MTSVLTRPEVVHDIRRRELLGLLAAAGMLAGCSTRPESDAAASSPAAVTWSSGPFDPVDVPRDPQRVVACNAVDADFALVLGLPLVGAPGAIGTRGTPFADYHADRLVGVEESVTGGEPNLEQVATLRPDLILDSWDAERDRYDGWSGLAPTVNFAPALYPDDFARTDWPGALQALGALFDRQQQVDDALTAYQDAVSAAAARLTVAGSSFAAVNGFGGEGLVVIDAGQQVSVVATDLGLTASPLVSPEPSSRTALSLEEISQLDDVDVLFVAVAPSAGSLERDRTALEPTLSSPLWQRLPAVQQGRVVEYPLELYYASPLTAPGMAQALADGLSR